MLGLWIVELEAIDVGRIGGGREGLNSKIRLITRWAFGFHSAQTLSAMIHLCCDGIPLYPSPETHINSMKMKPRKR